MSKKQLNIFGIKISNSLALEHPRVVRNVKLN